MAVSNHRQAIMLLLKLCI